MPPPPRGAKWTEPPRIIDRLEYQDGSSNYVQPGYNHIFVVSPEGGAPRQLTTGDFDHTGARWTADSRSLMFSAARVPEAEYHKNPRSQNNKSEVYKVDVETGELTQITNREGPDERPIPSPDGRHIAFTRDEVRNDVYWD